MLKLPNIIRLSLALVACFCLTASADVKVGEKAPDFAVKGLDGKSIPLKSLQGKTVVLEWINDGCPFVRGQYDSGKMQALQKKYAKDVVWIWVASSAPGKQGYHSAAEWKDLVKREKASPAHVVMDPDGKIGRLYGAKTTPHMFVIDKSGTLVYQGAIDDKKEKNYVDAALRSLAAGEKIAVTTTKAYGCSVKYKE